MAANWEKKKSWKINAQFELTGIKRDSAESSIIIISVVVYAYYKSRLRAQMIL